MSFLYSTEVPPREGEVPVPLSVYRSGSRARTCPGKCTAMMAPPGKCPTAWIFLMGCKVRVAYIVAFITLIHFTPQPCHPNGSNHVEVWVCPVGEVPTGLEFWTSMN